MGSFGTDTHLRRMDDYLGKDDSLREWDGWMIRMDGRGRMDEGGWRLDGWMIRMGSFGTDDKDRDGTK
jgi:hypothetical protein